MKDWGNSRSQSQESGWTLGWVSVLDRNARTIWIADAHRDNGKRLVARAAEKLTAFIELETAVRLCTKK
jgi:hypothetical protein